MEGRIANFGIFLDILEFLCFGWFFPFFQKIWAFGYSWSTLLWYWCYYLHRSRDDLSPICGIFYNLYSCHRYSHGKPLGKKMCHQRTVKCKEKKTQFLAKHCMFWEEEKNLKYKKLYTDNIHVSVTNSMSVYNTVDCTAYKTTRTARTRPRKRHMVFTIDGRCVIFNRPGVAGPVLQLPLWFIH